MHPIVSLGTVMCCVRDGEPESLARGERRRRTAVGRDLEQELVKFFVGDACLELRAGMKSELLHASEGRCHRHDQQAAIASRKRPTRAQTPQAMDVT